MSAFVRQKILNPPAVKEPPPDFKSLFFFCFITGSAGRAAGSSAVLPQCQMQGGVVPYLIEVEI